MRYVVLIIDGAAGLPLDELGGQTTLEAAHTPYLDRAAREGRVGLAHTVPGDMEPSSAVACMSVMGFDPVRYYAGRGPIEALAMGIHLEPGEVALRCNLVTVEGGIMRSYAAGNISSEQAAALTAAVREQLEDDRVRFYHGVGFRGIVTVRQGAGLMETECFPPHDVADQPVAGYLPRGSEGELLRGLMERSREILSSHPINVERAQRGELPANQLWIFWPGMEAGLMPSFREAYGRRGLLTSGVDLLKGLAGQMAVEVLEIPGVTDGGDNDFAGQMEGALEALDDESVVFVHVEAPDEAGHAGDARSKIRAVENVDRHMISRVMEEGEDLSLLALPDHPTPVALKTHTAAPVPFVMWGKDVRREYPAGAFTEAEAEATGLRVEPGHHLLAEFLGRERKRVSETL